MINRDRLLATFLELVSIDSPSGQEDNIGLHLAVELKSMGLTAKRDAIRNVVAKLDGEGEPVLLSAHMDTVAMARGVTPMVEDGVVRTDGHTALGADDKAGVAIILEVLQTLIENEWPHPPLEVIITVGEEDGLKGAHALNLSRLQAKEALVLDSGGPIGSIVVAAPSQNKIFATVHGKAAHAGAEPEEGINAIRVAAEAIVAMPLGRIDEETTANIGRIQGGTATNIVPDRVEIKGEARSHDDEKLEAQTQTMIAALEEAAEQHGATVEVKREHSYSRFALSEDTPLVERAMKAVRSVGLEPALVVSGGGSDANVFNANGITAINLSTGMVKPHTTEEFIAIDDMVKCAELVTAFLRTS